jgi:hypothetical protein
VQGLGLKLCTHLRPISEVSTQPERDKLPGRVSSGNEV